MGKPRNVQPDKSGFGESWRAAVYELAISYAVNHPRRLDCLVILILRVASAKEIAAELDISVPDAAHHIDALYKDGVAEYVKTETGGSRRNAPEHFYRATALPEVTEEDWLKMPHDCRRQMAGRVLQAIVALGLSAMRCQTMEIDDNLNLGWQAVPVDDEGEVEAAELLAETSKKAMEIKVRNQKRLAKAGKEGTIRIIATMGFYQPDPGTWPGRLRDSQ